MTKTRETIAENIAVYNVMVSHAVEFQTLFQNPGTTEDQLVHIYDHYLGTISRMRYQFQNRAEYLRYGLPFELNHDLIKKIISHHMDILQSDVSSKIQPHKQDAIRLLQIVIDETNSFIKYYQEQLYHLDSKILKEKKSETGTRQQHLQSESIRLDDLQKLYDQFYKTCQLALNNYRSNNDMRYTKRRAQINELLNLSIKITTGKVLVNIQDLKDLVNLYIDEFVSEKNLKRNIQQNKAFTRNEFFRLGLNPKNQYTFFLATLHSLINEFQNQK